MEELTIPGWALLAFGGIIIPWLLWLTHKTNQNDKDIAINTANDATVNAELEKINSLISTRFNTLEEKFEKVDNKLTQILLQTNQFLSQESVFLKQLIKP